MRKQKSRRTFAKFLMGSLIVTGIGHAGDELDQYWDQALKKSESVYGNRKVDLTLEAGLETEGVRIDGDQLTSSDGGFKGNIRFQSPNLFGDPTNATRAGEIRLPESVCRTYQDNPNKPASNEKPSRKGKTARSDDSSRRVRRRSQFLYRKVGIC
jgi:hypothetical protein